MFKVIVVALALAVTLVAAQTDSSGGGGCSDDSNFVGTQPQNKDKKCADQSPENCKFIDESIQKCCQTCKTRQNENSKDSTASPDGKKGGKKKGSGCFHGDDIVHTKEYGTISMSQLAEKRDAQVLTRDDNGQLAFSSVRYWLHARPNLSMKFFTLSTESGHKLAITAEHLIYETDCQGNGGQAIFAEKVQLGRCLYVNENGQLKESRIVQKEEEKMTGIYAPITTAGSIVVNDVLASCYTTYENEPLQKQVFQYMIQFQDMLADWMPSSLYQAAFNNQNGAVVTIPRLIFNFLQLSNYFVH